MSVPHDIGELVTFTPNKFLPIHNWFYYKEGYAKQLVEWIVEEYKITGKIFDPFCGVGTTLLAAKELGLTSIGCDVSPLTSMVSRAKTRNYDTLALRAKLDEIRKERFPYNQITPRDKRLKKIISRQNYEEMVFLKKQILGIKDEKVQDFFYTALVDSFSRAAMVEKVGGSIRRVKKDYTSLRRFFEKKSERMIIDLEKHMVNFKEPVVLQEDARLFVPEEESIDAVITSPPYLNKIEYTTVYKLELILFFNAQETRLRAFIGDEPQNYIEGELPAIAQAYFQDLEKVLHNSFIGLKKKGMMFIIVAGGCLPEEVIQSDEVIAEIGEKIGFKKIDIIPAREIFCHKHRSIKIGKVRESIVVLQKP